MGKKWEQGLEGHCGWGSEGCELLSLVVKERLGREWEPGGGCSGASNANMWGMLGFQGAANSVYTATAESIL